MRYRYRIQTENAKKYTFLNIFNANLKKQLLQNFSFKIVKIYNFDSL